MLVLSRKKDEVIVINGDIEVVVLDIRPGRVKLGIKSATKVPVHRKEVFDAIQREQTPPAA
jgi:carbon storage regulator